MNYIKHLDQIEIIENTFLFILIFWFIKYVRYSFITLMVSFEEIYRMKNGTLNKIGFFILSSIHNSVGSSLFLYLIIFMYGFFDIKLLAKNINFLIVLNTFIIIYCFWKSFIYTFSGTLSYFNTRNELLIEQQNKLKNLKNK